MIQRKALGHISEDLLHTLLSVLHPIALNAKTTQYHVGYFNAQADFRAVLTHHLNAGELPEVRPKQEPASLPIERARWWHLR